MSTRDDDFEQLCDRLATCIEQCQALHLDHAVYLLKMVAMEIADPHNDLAEIEDSAES
ncbi:hypothetical protein [Rhodopseudomonas palustris]|uniref:hypothetical protein n=1 Tax=Rhodopseudomonas palustris TaxID=1076 RepID=UPI0012EE9017|nr:hypothetical protein [Rhodopseudomonas palustris]